MKKPQAKLFAWIAGSITAGAAALAVIWKGLVFLLATEFISQAQAKVAHEEISAQTTKQIESLRIENADAHARLDSLLQRLLDLQLKGPRK